MLAYARNEAEQGPVAAPRVKPDRPTVTLLGEMFPADPVGIGMMLEPLGLAAGPVVPTREWRELYAALDCAVVGAIHPFYTASMREFEAAGRGIVVSAPVGAEGTAAWLDAIGAACGVAQDRIDAAKNRFLPAIRGALAANPIKGRITVTGYEGSELLVARLLIESGADVPYVGTASGHGSGCGRSRLAGSARGARAVPRQSGAGHCRRRGIRAGPGDRHHAGGAACQAEGDPGALFHQPDFGPAADGRGRGGQPGAGGQCRHGQQAAL
jgi:chlorophyllide a reductase subunit Y